MVQEQNPEEVGSDVERQSAILTLLYVFYNAFFRKNSVVLFDM